jgi:hypothetical protein
MKYAAGNTMYGGFIAPGPRTSFFATDAALQNTGALGQALLLEVMAVAAGM